MTITKNCVVSLQYEMYDEDNKLLDKTEDDISYIHGGYDGIFPIVEEQLHGKDINDKVDVTMLPVDAFGQPEEDLIRIEPIEAFPSDINIGMMFEADDHENGGVLIFRVTDIADDQVVIDANHPLAGQKIRFVATVTGVRQATEEEIEHGHVHDGHAYHR